MLAVLTAVLALVAYFGLRAIALSKKDMKNRALREDTQCAIERCGELGRDVLPLFHRILRQLQSNKIPVFVGNVSQVSFLKEEEDKKLAAAAGWVELLDANLKDDIIDLLNRLECWAIYFTTDPAMADEKVAFDPCSVAFCQMVMTLYAAVLLHRRVTPESGPFQNIVTLFQAWYAKTAQGPMLEQIRRLQSDGAKLPPTIGTSLDRGP